MSDTNRFDWLDKYINNPVPKIIVKVDKKGLEAIRKQQAKNIKNLDEIPDTDIEDFTPDELDNITNNLFL